MQLYPNPKKTKSAKVPVSADYYLTVFSTLFLIHILLMVDAAQSDHFVYFGQYFLEVHVIMLPVKQCCNFFNNCLQGKFGVKIGCPK